MAQFIQNSHCKFDECPVVTFCGNADLILFKQMVYL